MIAEAACQAIHGFRQEFLVVADGAGGCPMLPVLRDGQLVGLLAPENVLKLVLIREAIRGRRVPGVAPAVSRHG